MYTVHPDMQSHIVVFMSHGKGTTYNTSAKQKLNRKSSIEAKLDALDSTMVLVLWTRHFLVAHGE